MRADERNEFNRMIRFVKNQKEGVSAILVYSMDRFSRRGDNAILISSELNPEADLLRRSLQGRSFQDNPGADNKATLKQTHKSKPRSNV